MSSTYLVWQYLAEPRMAIWHGTARRLETVRCESIIHEMHGTTSPAITPLRYARSWSAVMSGGRSQMPWLARLRKGP